MNAAAAPTPRLILALAFLGLLLVLGGYNQAIAQKEALLAKGTTVRLQLAPRDPRSLLTGDYMVLNYTLANELRVDLERELRQQIEQGKVDPRVPGRRGLPELPPQDGYAIVKADEIGVARLVRRQTHPGSLAAGESALKFRVRERNIGLGTNAYFFQEGRAKQYEPAQIGEYRVNAQGEMLLVRLLDGKFNPL